MDLPECFHAFDLWEESDTSEQEQTRALQKETIREENRKWKRALRNAAISNNEGEVKQLLASRSASQLCDRFHQTNVVAALRQVTSERMVKAFADAAPDIFRDTWAPATLLDALEHGRKDQLELLLGVGVPADAEALQAACVHGQVACARLLLAHGADASRQVHGLSLLQHAAEGGSAECVEALLDGGADVDARDDRGRTALHWAAHFGVVECARVLIAQGADLEARESSLDDTPLLMVAKVNPVHDLPTSKTRREHLKCLKELVRLGADACATDRHGNNALFLAIMNRVSDVFKYLIDEFVDLSKEKNIDGETALHVAASGGVEFVRHLVTVGIDVNCKRNDGMTPLHCAVQSWNTCCVKELLELGADIVACDSHGCTPLHYAAKVPYMEIFRLLVDGGCDITLTNNEGETPLHIAAMWGSYEFVWELLDRGADSNAKTNNRRTPAHCAARRWDPSYMKELLKHGADINARDENGWTILHHAADGDSIPIIKFVVQQGFDLETRTVQDRTALHLAVKAGHHRCVLQLLQQGAFVNARDKDERTPLHEAAQGTIVEEDWAQESSENIVRSLLEGGADRLARDAEGHAPADLAISVPMQRLIRRWAIAA